MSQRRFPTGAWMAVCAATLTLLSGYAWALQESASQGPTPQEKLTRALNRLDSVAPSLSAEEKDYLPAIRAILTRYYTEPSELLPSERELAEAALKDLGLDGGLQARGGSRRLSLVSSLLGSSKPAATPSTPAATRPSTPARPTTTRPATRPATRPQPRPEAAVVPVQPGRRPIPGVNQRAVFSARVNRVGGKEVGIVTMRYGQKTSQIVEIPSGLPGFPVSRRATLVAGRLNELQKVDRLWWSSLSVGNVRGEVIVRAPKAENGTLLTADADWARAWGVDREQLARLAIKNIRDGLREGGLRSRGATPEQRRLNAINLRLEGDGLLESNPAEAAIRYDRSMQADPTYILAYERLSEAYTKLGDAEKARKALEAALLQPGITAEEKAAIEKKLGEMNP